MLIVSVISDSLIQHCNKIWGMWRGCSTAYLVKLCWPFWDHLLSKILLREYHQVSYLNCTLIRDRRRDWRFGELNEVGKFIHRLLSRQTKLQIPISIFLAISKTWHSRFHLLLFEKRQQPRNCCEANPDSDPSTSLLVPLPPFAPWQYWGSCSYFLLTSRV